MTAPCSRNGEDARPVRLTRRAPRDLDAEAVGALAMETRVHAWLERIGHADLVRALLAVEWVYNGGTVLAGR